MTSIGCDCIILVIMNGYVHLGSEGGQYVGHERAAKLVPTWVPEGGEQYSGAILCGIESILFGPLLSY